MKAASAQGRRFNPHAISRKIGRVFDDSEDEYDPEMSEFIDDEGDDLSLFELILRFCYFSIFVFRH